MEMIFLFRIAFVLFCFAIPCCIIIAEQMILYIALLLSAVFGPCFQDFLPLAYNLQPETLTF